MTTLCLSHFFPRVVMREWFNSLTLNSLPCNLCSYSANLTTLIRNRRPGATTDTSHVSGHVPSSFNVKFGVQIGMQRRHPRHRVPRRRVLHDRVRSVRRYRQLFNGGFGPGPWRGRVLCEQDHRERRAVWRGPLRRRWR